jgi:hypothetical protein
MPGFNPTLNVAALKRKQKNLTKEFGGLAVPYYKMDVAADEGTPVKLDTSKVDTVMPLVGADGASCFGLLLQNVIDDSTYGVWANMHYPNDTRTRPGNAVGVLTGQGYASTLWFTGAVTKGAPAYFDPTTKKLTADATVAANKLPIIFDQDGNSDIANPVNGTYPTSYVHPVRIRFNFDLTVSDLVH